MALLIVAFLVGFLVRLIFEMPVYAHGSDYLHHLLIARSLADGEGFQSGGSQHPDLSRPPLFPMLTAGLSRLTGNVEVAAHLVVLLSSALVVVPLYSLARRAFGPRAGLCALPLGVISGLLGSAGLMTEPLFLFLGLSAGAAAWNASRRPRKAAFFVAGLLAGASALARFEGLALVPALCAWAALGTARRRGWTTRLTLAMVFLTGALLLYAPYAAWASLRLGRWAPAPGVHYLQDMRLVADRLDLRHIDGPWVTWTEWSPYLMAADHKRRVLETYFNEGVLPDPDPVFIASGTATETVATDPPLWTNIVKRRLSIVFGNLRDVPYRLRASGFLPVVPVALGIVGAFAALRTRRARRALLYLVIMGAVSFAPAMSHLEGRFFYLPFAFGLVVSAGGWGLLADRLSRLGGSGGRTARMVVQVGLVGLVASSGLHHHAGHTLRYQLASFRKELGPIVSRELPPGPVLAVQMHVPYWAGRVYCPIPMSDPASLLDYARAHGAAGVFYDSVQDTRRRPHLAPLLEEPPPPGFRLVLVKPRPEGGEVRVLAVISQRDEVEPPAGGSSDPGSEVLAASGADAGT